MTARTGFPVVVAAPSGTGKTTVCREVVARDPQIEFSISHSTRAQRPRERDGVDYHFVTPEQFERLVAQGAFLEWAEYNGNLYGTSWAALDEPLRGGRDLLLEIEVQGARQVRERRSDARFIFLVPPTLATLRQRLEQRGSDDPAGIAKRLAIARREIEEGANFDYAVVNDDLGTCVADLLAILVAERSGDTARLRERHAPGPVIANLLRNG